MQDLSDLPRREYGQRTLSEEGLPDSPWTLFSTWFQEALNSNEIDPSAMALSTVDAQGDPNTRMVLLKQVQSNSLIFFTDYRSVKAKELEHHDRVALNFYWSSCSRQIRIRGRATKVARELSAEYFSTRPRESQQVSILSHQSQRLGSRLDLERAIETYDQRHPEPLSCPEHWGGYAVIPVSFEFFQGRDNRFSDRIAYSSPPNWSVNRLSP